MTLILASTSMVRRRILEDAGVAFTAIAPACDEEAAKHRFRAEGLAQRAQAEALAELKAVSVSGAEEGLVIGADQMLAINGAVLDKPKSRAEARAHLQQLRGQTHELITAVVVAREGAVLWRCLETPRLTMRDFSSAFLDAYLDSVGENVLRSVGAYQLEGLGAQLFERVEGDYFSVLGLPLLPLMAFLREQGVVAR
jgi:nucleoside triphosphate pyrophosphatase